MPRASRRSLVVALLVILALVWLPRSWQDDVDGARADLRMSSTARADARGPLAAAGTDLRLVLAARARMPRHASFALVRGGRFGTDAHPNPGQAFVWESGQSWTQYQLAPRVEVAPDRASWLLVRDASPASLADVRPGRAWRFGADSLVRVR